MANRKQRKHENMLLRKAAEQRKKKEAILGINQKIKPGLSGPERWALVDSIQKNNNKKVNTDKLQSWRDVEQINEDSYINRHGQLVTKTQKAKGYISKTDYKKLKSI
jgi:hypothetical protein